MVDNLAQEKRSRIMASIHGKNTRPEVMIRKLLFAAGKRYRIHDRSVFGIPDISNKRKKLAIFIDGCFWHGCDKCYRQPTTNTDFWKEKVARNKSRRNMVKEKLAAENWKVLEFWEHEVLGSPEEVVGIILEAIDSTDIRGRIRNEYQ